MTLQQKLQRLINEKQITLGIISEKTGVTPRTIQNYARGKTVPKTQEKYLTVCEQIDELYKKYPNKKPTSKYSVFRKYVKTKLSR
ncbi:MAG: helix-turn-helix transcriptional regulator [Ruminococcaceae bacterium]|nr:helix-turn-helix transcriptional regulator [Oscillospiraceae bacterium]